MSIVSIYFAFLCLFYAEAKECEITAVIAYSHCLQVCKQKYGSDQATQRFFYNPRTGFCEKAIRCVPPKMFVNYQNRCADYFFEQLPYQTGIWRYNDPDRVKVYNAIIEHGSLKNAKQVCYPGFISSEREILYQGDQITTKYYCDIRVGDDEYPQTFGDYYFNTLSYPERREILDRYFGSELDNGSIFIIAFAFVFLFLSFVELVVWFKNKVCSQKTQNQQSQHSKIVKRPQNTSKVNSIINNEKFNSIFENRKLNSCSKNMKQSSIIRQDVKSKEFSKKSKDCGVVIQSGVKSRKDASLIFDR